MICENAIAIQYDAPQEEHNNTDCYVLTLSEASAMMRAMSPDDVMDVTGGTLQGRETLQ